MGGCGRVTAGYDSIPSPVTTAAIRHDAHLYAIVDLPHPSGCAAVAVARAICEGAGGRLFALQLRMKGASTRERVAAARAVAPVTAAFNVPLWMNDDGAAALAAGPPVAGLHVGQADEDLRRIDAIVQKARAGGRHLAVGISTHDETQHRRAEARAPSLVAFGPVRRTATKANPDSVVGFEGIGRVARRARRPLVAIGGLRAADADAVARAGAAAMAVISALAGPDLDAVRARARALSRAVEAAFAPWDEARVAEAVPVLDRTTLADLADLADDPACLRSLGLPPRFRPVRRGGTVWYRPCDVADLLDALDKHPCESWQAWRARHPATAPLLAIGRGPR